ncbi:SHOCT domain-containing protein [Weissella confusa]|uniref:SHOCT domain-containing protein n=1 Tax=Weissella confusa TaxID=1583 RepID=UPI0022E87DD0|nr:SHOCT domain-containing protein [Weissella confusa]
MADVSKITSELKRLKDMLDSGALTQEEFDTLKTNLLAEMNQQEPRMANRVEQNPKNNRNGHKKALVATLAAVVIVGDGVGAFVYSQQKGAEAESAKIASSKAKSSSEKKAEAEKASRKASHSASAKSASEKLASEKAAQSVSQAAASSTSSQSVEDILKAKSSQYHAALLFMAVSNGSIQTFNPATVTQHAIGHTTVGNDGPEYDNVQQVTAAADDSRTTPTGGALFASITYAATDNAGLNFMVNFRGTAGQAASPVSVSLVDAYNEYGNNPYVDTLASMIN